METTEKSNSQNEIQITEKHGFHRWTWLIIFFLGGLLMIFGGVQDVLLFFMPSLDMVPPWHPIPPIIGLICGILVIISAIITIILSLLLRNAKGIKELRLVYCIISFNFIGLIADWISGYYGFGCLVAIPIGFWLLYKIRKNKESGQ